MPTLRPFGALQGLQGHRAPFFVAMPRVQVGALGREDVGMSEETRDTRRCVDCIYYATEVGACCYYYRQTLPDEPICGHFISGKEIA